MQDSDFISCAPAWHHMAPIRAAQRNTTIPRTRTRRRTANMARADELLSFLLLLPVTSRMETFDIHFLQYSAVYPQQCSHINAVQLFAPNALPSPFYSYANNLLPVAGPCFSLWVPKERGRMCRESVARVSRIGMGHRDRVKARAQQKSINNYASQLKVYNNYPASLNSKHRILSTVYRIGIKFRYLSMQICIIANESFANE